MERIEDRNRGDVDPDGKPWPKNNPVYAAYKEKKYSYSEINRRTSQMLSHQSLSAGISVQPDTVTLTYGTGERPSVSKAPSGFLSKSDRRVDDKTKALMAHATGRGFFRPGEGDQEAVVEVCQEALSKHISDFNEG